MNNGEWFSLIIVALIGCFIVLVFINFDKFRIKFLKYKDDDCYGPFFVELMFKAADKGGQVAENISNTFKDVLDKKRNIFRFLLRDRFQSLLLFASQF